MKSFRFFEPALATTLGIGFWRLVLLSNGCLSYRLSQARTRGNL